MLGHITKENTCSETLLQLVITVGELVFAMEPVTQEPPFRDILHLQIHLRPLAQFLHQVIFQGH